MIKEVIQSAINLQIAREIYSSNLYLSMAGYYTTKNLHGFANWMRIQAEEEMTHALKLFDYLLDRGGKPIISAIAAPPSEWENTVVVFENAYHHEQLVTSWIHELADLAIAERDHATSSMLKWFIDEQVEEEATTGEIYDRLCMIGDNPTALFFLDNELKTRKMTATVDAKATK